MINNTDQYESLNVDGSNFFNYILIGRTALIKLRPISYNDIICFRKFVAEDEIWKYFAHKISCSQDMDDYVTEALSQRKNELRYHFAIECQETREVIGSTAFGNYSQKDSRIEIGWSWLESKSQGQNINRDVKFLSMDLAFNHLNVKRIEFKTDHLNLRAKKALVKIGASEEGILRKHTLMPDGRHRDTVYYSILKHEWETKIKLEHFSEFSSWTYKIANEYNDSFFV